MRRRTEIAIMALLLLAAPIVPLAISNGRRMIAGNGFEPLADNAIAYVVLLAIFSAAALPMLALFFWIDRSRCNWRDTFTYALVGAVGSTAFMVLLDAADDYFTRPGVGWQWPVSGLLLGATFGAAFKIVCSLVARDRSTSP